MSEAEPFVEIPKSRLWSPAEAAARKLWARRFITEITGVARGLGYGVFHGGSLIRDIDLVAVPWRARTWKGESQELTHTEFVLELCRCLPLQMGNHGETLFGHRWYALWHIAHRDHQIDLKVMLPAGRVTGDGEDRVEAALRWYGDEVEALARNLHGKRVADNPQAIEASLVVLSLDGGRRAHEALPRAAAHHEGQGTGYDSGARGHELQGRQSANTAAGGSGHSEGEDR